MSVITGFCLDWHIDGGSAVDLVNAPLELYFEVDWYYWDGVSLDETLHDNQIYLFHQFLPPADFLTRAKRPILWTPMWDNVRSQPQSWWDRLPKTLHVIAFSEATYVRATRAGLTSLRLHYYKNPAEFEPVSWTQGRVLSYWNRVGLIGPDFLAHLCDVLKVDKLLFKSEADLSYVDLAAYDLPSKLGRTEVKTLPTFASREEYLAATSEANIFIAPRTAEGAGMTFLEAMARGCAVLAYNEATMNEYITSGEDGYFFRRYWNAERVVRGIREKFARRGLGKYPPFKYTLLETDQDWSEIAALDIQTLGETTRQRHLDGYNLWQSEIPQYARFLREAVNG